MDLTPYIARGFPGDADRQIAQTPVAGIDREQAQSMVRLCPETAPVLYGPEFSPRAIAYRAGSRPLLEAVPAGLPCRTSRDSVDSIHTWVREHVRHPHLAGFVAPDRALSEEGLIDSGVGWCNEQARVFIALCGVAGIPARLCFLFHSNERCGHTATEVWLEGKWAFCDVTFGVLVMLPTGEPASGLDLQGHYRALAHEAYRAPLTDYLAHVRPEFDHVPGWGLADRPEPNLGGELLHAIGICNYVPEGVERDEG